MHLTSRLKGEKGDHQLPVGRPRDDTCGKQEVGEEEMSMGEIREQLHVMQEQIEYLKEQQHSAWAQGFSDEPPPGYMPTMGYSGLTVFPLS